MKQSCAEPFFKDGSEVLKHLRNLNSIQEKFSVKPVTVKDVENIIKNIPNNKASGEEILLTFLSNLDLLMKC